STTISTATRPRTHSRREPAPLTTGGPLLFRHLIKPPRSRLDSYRNNRKSDASITASPPPAAPRRTSPDSSPEANEKGAKQSTTGPPTSAPGRMSPATVRASAVFDEVGVDATVRGEAFGSRAVVDHQEGPVVHH